jgi:lambda repressor-like predicted transcriptional regulator
VTAEEVRRIARQEAASVVRAAFEAAEQGTMASVQATGKPDLDMALSYALATLDAPQEQAPTLDLTFRQMVVCPICGNKRCPHAGNALAVCTNSNEPDQVAKPWPPPSPALPELPPMPERRARWSHEGMRAYPDGYWVGHRHYASLRSTAEQYLAEIERLQSLNNSFAKAADYNGDVAEEQKQRADAAEAALKACEAERNEARNDVVLAAGEFFVEIPEPGTPMARLLLANVALRRERDRLAARIAEAEGQEPWKFAVRTKGMTTWHLVAADRLKEWPTSDCERKPIYAHPIPADSVPRAEHEAALLCAGQIRQIPLVPHQSVRARRLLRHGGRLRRGHRPARRAGAAVKVSVTVEARTPTEARMLQKGLSARSLAEKVGVSHCTMPAGFLHKGRVASATAVDPSARWRTRHEQARHHAVDRERTEREAK